MARQPLTIAEKNELRRFYASQHGAVKHSEMLDWVQTKFGKSMGRSSIGRILNSEVDVDEATMGPKRMRKRSSNYPGVEAALLTFILENRDKVLLTDDVLWDQARLAAEGHAVSMSWIQRFKNRNGIKAKSRSLLSGGSVDGDDTQAAFIAALTKKRDELLEVVANTSSSNNNTSAKEEQPKRDGEEAEEDTAAGTDASKLQEQQPQTSTIVTAVTATPEKAIASPAKKKAQTPAKSSPKAASPRFTVVSQATGRVELENRADPKRLRKPKPVTKLPITVQSETTAPAAATPEPAPVTPTPPTPAPVAGTATATNPAPASPARTPERKRSREESEEQVADAREQPKEQETPSRQQETPSRQKETLSHQHETPSKQHETPSKEQFTPSKQQQDTPSKQQQDTPSKAVDDREVELRVEGLRCDNILKRIKIAEENMLARKRLKDAGISQEEIDALLPIVRIV